MYDLDQRKMLKHVCTRWLSIGRCLDRLLTNWTSLLHFCREENKKTEKRSKKEDSSYAASKMETVSTFSNPHPTIFSASYCPTGYTLKVYDKVLNGLQAEGHMVGTHRAASTGAASPGPLQPLPQAISCRWRLAEEMQYALRENQKDDEDLLIGSALSDMIKDPAAHNL